MIWIVVAIIFIYTVKKLTEGRDKDAPQMSPGCAGLILLLTILILIGFSFHMCESTEKPKSVYDGRYKPAETGCVKKTCESR
jgi:hypothetical protein